MHQTDKVSVPAGAWALPSGPLGLHPPYPHTRAEGLTENAPKTITRNCFPHLGLPVFCPKRLGLPPGGSNTQKGPQRCSGGGSKGAVEPFCVVETTKSGGRTLRKMPSKLQFEHRVLKGVRGLHNGSKRPHLGAKEAPEWGRSRSKPSRLHFICDRRRVGPGGHRPQGCSAACSVILGRHWLALAYMSPQTARLAILGRQEAIEWNLQGGAQTK